MPGSPLPAALLPTALAALLACSSVACMGSPSPLSPGLGGSVGIPHNGVLTDSSELPERGPGFRRFRPRAPVYFGLPRLVDALQRAAEAVERQRPGGAPLVVGDLSARTGGKIPRHNSHRTGRDVDLLFYLLTPEGAPIDNPGFYDLEADGFVKLPTGRFARLDVARQWLLIKALLTDPEIDVQFLFISKELEGLIVDYALARETDLALIWHAQTVMLQPGDSLPHGDHIHMRVACRPEEAVAGCSGGGPHWPWFTPLPYLDDSLEALLSEISTSDPPPFGAEPAPPEELRATVEAPRGELYPREMLPVARRGARAESAPEGDDREL